MHQYLFHVGGFPVRMYGIIMCLAIFLGTAVSYFLAKKDGHGWHEHIMDIGIYGGFAGIIGGRLWDVFFFDWEYYSGHLLQIPFVWQGGMAIQGGITGGILAGIYYCKKHNVDWVALLDVITPALLIGQSVGRMANLLNGDAFGSPTGSNFGILYPIGTLAHQTYGSVPLWPAEIWEGQIDVILFALLLLFQTTKYARGQVFFLYVILYSGLRFFLEMLRGDYVQPLFWGLKSAQATSLVFIIVATILFFWSGWQQNNRENKPIKKSNKKTTS